MWSDSGYVSFLSEGIVVETVKTKNIIVILIFFPSLFVIKILAWKVFCETKTLLTKYNLNMRTCIITMPKTLTVWYLCIFVVPFFGFIIFYSTLHATFPSLVILWINFSIWSPFTICLIFWEIYLYLTILCKTDLDTFKLWSTKELKCCYFI